MTRLSTLNLNPPRPHAVLLGELAIAAGIAGRPVTLCYEGFSGPELCEIWKYFARGLEAEQVAHIRTPSDVRRLGTRIGEVRLVLVHAARLHSATAWANQMAPTVPGEIEPRPAVFTRGVPDDLDEAPGATLVLRASDGQTTAITRWSIMTEHAGPDWGNIHPCTSLQIDPEVVTAPVFDHSSYAARGLRRIQERQVLQGLLMGAGLLRSVREGPSAGVAINVAIDDYALVRRLLQSRLVATPDVPVDQMAVDMLNRANVYLEVKYGPDLADRNPFQTDDDFRSQGDRERPGRPLVTRREIADLGNVRSGMVRRLIGYLQRRNGGYQLFGRLGLVRRPPGEGDWASGPTERLASILRPWTVKQTRTSFGRLHRLGLITAERDPPNGPWRYMLPEEFTGVLNPYRHLPPADRLATTPVGNPEHAAG